MRFRVIEHVWDLLAFVGSKSGYIDQGLYAFWTCQSDDRAGIREQVVPRADAARGELDTTRCREQATAGQQTEVSISR
jgi:hypothetical protein